MTTTPNVTQHVILDLLPLYLAGEASADSRALIEEYFRAHPEEERELRALAAHGDALFGTPPPPPPPGLERTTLERTKRFTRWRSQLLVFAIVYSLVPVYLLFETGSFDWQAVAARPKRAILFGLAGIGCAVARWILGWRLRTGR